MNDLARLLVEHTAAVTAAVLAVAALRRPLRKLFGAEAAYWVWLLVPFAHLAVALPARVVYVDVVAAPVGTAAVSDVTALSNATSGTARIDFAAAATIVWLCGALLTTVLSRRRHRKWLRSLSITVGPDGSSRSTAARGPAVFGILSPVIVLPTDFEERYGPQERALMLAHEAAHVARRDLLVAALAAAWSCLFWFNPLVHWAFGRLRFDQDLACDAAVMRSAGGEKRRYAAALLATQLAADDVRPSLAACHWHSTHPLAERIAALKRRPPGDARRIAGAWLTGTVCVVACGALWMSLPQAVAQPADASSSAEERASEGDSSTPAQIENATDGTTAGAPSTLMSFQASQGHMTDASTFIAEGNFRAELGGSVCVDNFDRITYSRTDSGANVFELSPLSWLVFERGRIVLQGGASGTLTERNGQLTFEAYGPVVVESRGTYRCRGVVLPFAWARPPMP